MEDGGVTGTKETHKSRTRKKGNIDPNAKLVPGDLNDILRGGSREKRTVSIPLYQIDANFTSSYLGGFLKPLLTTNSIADISAEKFFVVVFSSPHHSDFVEISAVNVVVVTSV